MKRRPVPQKKSQRVFNKTAGSNKVHSKNTRPMPMRGGYRL